MTIQYQIFELDANHLKGTCSSIRPINSLEELIRFIDDDEDDDEDDEEE